MPKIAILGSTGSIGCNALEVIRNLGNSYTVTALSARSNWKVLQTQIREFSPRSATIVDDAAYRSLCQAFPSGTTRVLQGTAGLNSIAGDSDTDLLLVAMSGAAGLQPTLTALESGKRVALANKESMVLAGPLMNSYTRRDSPRIIPVDSEHSAIFQALQCGRHDEIRRIILTTSGGPFLNSNHVDLEHVTPEQALKHPVWTMGKKITIDSATMMNKALEIVEARWLFNVPTTQIEVLVHPQSIIHSLVEYCDGSVIAQMSLPDMKTPIQYALTYPNRTPAPVTFLDLAQIRSLTFQKPDRDKFPALDLGYRAAEQGGTLGAVMNAANEIAVQAFLDQKIPFLKIVETVDAVMTRHKLIASPDLHDIVEADHWARESAEKFLNL